MEFVDTSLTGQSQYVGFDVILANYIAKELDMSLVIKPMDFYACMTILANDQVDLAISGFSWTADRAEQFLISDYYIAGENETEQILITKAGDTFDWANATDFTGKKIGAQGGSLQQLLVEEQLVPKGATLVKNDDINMLKTMLMNGSVDAVAVARGNGAALTANTPELKAVNTEGEYDGFNFFVEEKYKNNVVLLNKNDAELLEKVNAILAKAMEAGVYDAWYDACEVYAGVSTKDESGYDEEGNPLA
jgi:polar amino acid transport system substrate-binding protein